MRQLCLGALFLFLSITFSFGQGFINSFPATGTGAVDNNGQIYLVDGGSNAIRVLDGNGSFLFQFGSPGSGNGQFNTPVAIAIDQFNNVFVVDRDNYRIQKFNNAGAFVATFGGTTGINGSFTNVPGYISVDNAGNIYVIETDNSSFSGVHKYDNSGNYITTIGNAGYFPSPQRIAIDGGNNLYVYDGSNQDVSRFDEFGNFNTNFFLGQGNAFATGKYGSFFFGNLSEVITEYNNGGSPITNWGNNGGGNGYFFSIYDIFTNAARDRLYVYDDIAGDIEVYDITRTPPTQASFVSFSNVTGTSLDITWTNGDGDNRIVVGAQGASPTAPGDNTVYNANSTWGIGDDVGGGSYVVYQGSGNAVSVTNLLPNTLYYFHVYESHGAGTTIKYQTSVASNNPMTQITQGAAPTFQATTISFSGTTDISTQVTWSIGNGSRRMVVASLSPISGLPVDNTTYTADANFGSGSQLNPGEYVVYDGTENTVIVNSLTPNTTYEFRVFEYNGTSGSETYLTISDAGNPNSMITNSAPCFADAGGGNTANACNNDPSFDLFGVLTGTPDAGGTWTQLSGPGSPIITGDFVDLNGIPGGSYDFEYRVTEPSCPDVTAIVTVNVTEDLNAGENNYTSFCNPQGTITLTSYLGGSPTPGGTWTQLSGTPVTITGDQADLSGGILGSYTFQYDVNGCLGPDFAQLTFDIFNPPVANAGADAEVCETAGSFAFSSALASGAGFSWTHTGTGFFDNPSAMNPVYTFGPGETGVVTFTLQAAGDGPCVSVSDNIDVTITPAPFVNAGGNNTICEGGNWNIVDATASNYSSIFWTTSGTGTFTDPNALTTTYNPGIGETGPITLTLNVNGNGSCASVSGNKILTINPAGTVINPGNQTVCAGANTTPVIFSGTATSYSWTNSNPAIGLAPSGTGNISSFVASSPGTATITVTPDNSGCAGTPEFFTITVNPVGSVVNPGNQTVCVGTSTAPINFTGTATSYNWTNDNPSIGLAASGTGNIASFTAASGGTASISVMPDNAGCLGAPEIFTITATQLPTVANAGADQNICAAATILSANSPAVGFGNWSIVSGVGGNIANAPDPTSPFTGVQGNSYVLRWTITNGTCTPSFDDVIISFDANPTTANAGADITQCNNGSFTLAGNTPVIGAGTWTLISGGVSITTPSSPTSTALAVSPGTSATLRWTITNGACTASFDDVILTNQNLPTTANAGTDINQCNNGNFTLAGNTPVSGTGAWSVISGAATITTPTSPTSGVTGVPAGTSATLRWTISNGVCTASTDDVILTNAATPTAANAGIDISQCANGNFTLAGNTPVTGTGAWSVITGTATITTPTSPTSGVTGVPAGTSATLRWTISNGTCTASTDDVILTNNATPTTANAGADIGQCNNGNFTLAGNTPVTGTGAWSVISGAATITTPTSPTSGVTAVPAGTSATLRWTISNGVCTASTDDLILTNSATPTTANAGTDIGQCNNGNFTLAGNTPVTGTGAWSVLTGTATITTPASPASGVTGVPVGTSATLRWTITNGACTASTDDVILTNSATPTTANAGADISQCNNGSFTLAGNTPVAGTGAWSLISGTATITTPTSPTSGVTGVPAGTSATLRWTISNGVCTASTDDVILTNNAIPTTANAGADIGQCNNGNFTLAGNAPVTGTGAWSVISGAATITTPTSPTSGVTAVPAGTSATLRWTISNGVCTASTDDVILTNSATPATANAGIDISQCANGNFTLAGNTPVTGTGAWSVITGTATITTPTSPTSGVTGVSAGTSATLRWTISNGTCTASTDDVILTNSVTPTTANAGADIGQCNNGNFTLAGNTPVTGTGAWSVISGAATITTPTSPTSGVTAVPAGTSATLRWTISNGVCTASTDDVVLTNSATPTTANAGTDVSQCANGNFTLAGNTPVTGAGTWSVVAGTATIITPASPTSGVTGVPAGTSATLRWTISNGACTASADDVILTNTAAPTTANAGADINQCNNGNFTLAGNTPVTGIGAWSVITGAATITTPTSPTSGVTGVPAGTSATLRWTITNGACVASSDDVVLSNDALPTAANAGPDQNICGAATVLGGNTPSVGTGTWSIISGTGGNVANAPDPTSPFNGIQGNTYVLRWTIANGLCASSTDDVTIVFEQNAVTSNAGADVTQCNTGDFVLSGNSPAPGTGTWSIVSGTATITTPSSPTSGVTDVPAGTSVTLRWTITNGTCPLSFDDVLLTNNATPTVVNPGSQTICQGASTSTITFTGTATSYSWTNDNPAIGLAASGSGDIASFVTSVSGTALITVTPDNAGCSGTAEVFTIEVTPTGTVANPGNQAVCQGADTPLITFTGTATSYNWSNDNPSIGLAANGSGNIAQFTTTTTGVANITVTPDFAGCVGTPEIFSITVNPSGTVLNPGNQEVCQGSNTSAITFTGSATSYTWTNSNPIIGLAAAGSGDIASFTTTLSGIATITVVPDLSGCAGTAEIFTISVNDLPNVIINNLTPSIASGGETNILLSGNIPGTIFNFSAVAPPEIIGAKGGTNSSITQILTNSSADDRTVTFEIIPSTPQCVGVMQAVNVIVLGNPNLPTVITADSLALVALYQSARGAFWSKQDNWLTGKVNTWHGVTVGNMRVTMLDLSANSLSGMLPSEMTQLVGLLDLNLANNEITGNIILPSQLTVLHVANNNFNSWTGAPPQLAVIDVSSNRIAALPDLLSNPITSLNVTNNDLQFDDIEPLLGVSGFSYIPQNKVEEVVDILVETGTEQTFAAAVAGDSYQWYKNDVPIDTALSSAITLSDIQIADDAVYHYTVTSATVPGLTLERSDILLKVSSLTRDSIALRQFYTDTEGPSWINSVNWINTPLRTGNWNGVVIANSRVVGLTLPDNNISGAAMTLKDVGNLQNVDLSGNKITELPNLTALSALQTFDVSDNSLQFNSLEMNVGVTGINYANQKNVGSGSYSEVHASGVHTVGITVTGTANQYQWRREGVPVEQAVNDTHTISPLGRSNMGIYDCTITNPLVPGLTLVSNADTVYAVAEISGSVMISQEAMTDGRITLFKVTNVGGYDTTATYDLVDGSYQFSNVILADYQVHVLPNADVYPEALPTYYTNTIFWEEASIVELNDDLESIDIDVESLSAPVPEGNGIIRGFLEEDDGTSGGRIKAPKRVGNAGVALRREEGSGRGKETLTLIDYVITNENGEFEFTQLREATYKLNIQYPGYPMDETSDIEIQVGTGLESEITVGASVEGGLIVVRKLIVTGTLENYGVEAYPNPASEYLIMKFPSENISRTVMMYSLDGKQTLKSAAHDRTTRIDLKSVASGSYLIYVYENGRMKKTHHVIID